MRLNRDQKAILVVLLVGSVTGWILWRWYWQLV
jgi:hypothetical protein